ncbi:hypothetical protein QR680_018524 [Steinernema hermaphroditum]|uniref:Uncharacterized protein n=1 Tax=Steinernema hermaphroditum TaxID=289476 RepID=A0AA39HI80_9BILA|nr:hypothetical protein QR680_018524 [Steinernema hermaphroditum]
MSGMSSQIFSPRAEVAVRRLEADSTSEKKKPYTLYLRPITSDDGHKFITFHPRDIGEQFEVDKIVFSAAGGHFPGCERSDFTAFMVETLPKLSKKDTLELVVKSIPKKLENHAGEFLEMLEASNISFHSMRLQYLVSSEENKTRFWSFLEKEFQKDLDTLALSLEGAGAEDADELLNAMLKNAKRGVTVHHRNKATGTTRVSPRKRHFPIQ